ncbi:MAG: hypothetical protein HS127_20545 [Planctomycetia bacterium]|nr:hypothetical protein [Planctomycetia bacterium]MCC6324964.1 hypothetical protein [Candidatus Brocadia sp.]
MTINWTQHGTKDFLGQKLARGKGIHRTSMSAWEWGIIPERVLDLFSTSLDPDG